MPENTMTDPASKNPNEELIIDLSNQAIKAHNEYLDQLQAVFDKKCEEIGETAKLKLSKVDQNDQEAKAAIIKEEQEMLDKALAELRYAVNKSNAETRKKLEEIEAKFDTKMDELEKQLASL